MKLKSYERIGEQVYSETLPNGLPVFVIPKRGFNKSFAFFATDYGGADRRFCLGGDWIDTPAGVAHFLEHKMFDTKEGNALTDLSANGASPNAFTSSDITAYHFESTEKFEDNLKTLLSFVSIPYFTDESVAKEQGIIGQEIRMIEDTPNVSVYYGLLKALYKSNPTRDSVAGTVESIAQITADTLYSCHKVFYNPSNMALCVAGDVDPERILQIAAEILPKQPGPIPQRDYGEPEAPLPVTGRAEAEMEVSLPLFLIGAKADPEKRGREFLRQELIAELATELIAGKSSPFYTALYAEGLINSDFEVGFETSAGVADSVFGGESRDPDAVYDRLKSATGEIVKNGLDAKLFERVKKAMLGRQLRGLNSFDNVCYNYARGYFRGYDAFEASDIISGATPDDVMAFITQNLTSEKMAISIVAPRTENK